MPSETQPPMLPTLAVRREGALAFVTLNRPEQLNAVNGQMTADWLRLNEYLAGERSLRVVIVHGAGKAFCAGDDVKEVGRIIAGDGGIEAARELSLAQARMYLAWETLPQVMIAAVHGHCVGGGCVAAYSCDLRVAAYNARFGMPEILLGWPPGYGLAQLTALVGKARVLELCLTGNQISARQALAYGLANELVPLNQLLPAARRLAERLLAMPPEALRETKRLIHAHEGERMKETYCEDTAAYIECLKMRDSREGIAAFEQKRTPKFTGE